MKWSNISATYYKYKKYGSLRYKIGKTESIPIPATSMTFTPKIVQHRNLTLKKLLKRTSEDSTVSYLLTEPYKYVILTNSMSSVSYDSKHFI